MVLVYSSGEISVRKLADSLPVYVEVNRSMRHPFLMRRMTLDVPVL